MRRKEITSLYLEADVVKVLRAKGINISALVNDYLKRYVERIDSELHALLSRQRELEAELKAIQSAIDEKQQITKLNEEILDACLQHLRQIDDGWKTEEELKRGLWGFVTGKFPQLPRSRQTAIWGEALRRWKKLRS